MTATLSIAAASRGLASAPRCHITSARGMLRPLAQGMGRPTHPAPRLRPHAMAGGAGDEPAGEDKGESAVIDVEVQAEGTGGAAGWTYTGPMLPAEGAVKPVRFGVAEGKLLDVVKASGPAVFRVPSLFAAGWAPSIVADDPARYSLARGNGQMLEETSDVATFNRPVLPLEVYEFDGCPFCRKVREALCMLDLDAMYYPCPKNGPNFRPQVEAEGGKAQFPYLKDPNTGKAMYESDDIISYLYEEYGPGAASIPLHLNAGPLTIMAISAGRALSGPKSGSGAYVPSSLPKEPLVLWGLEGSPFVQIVREQLNSLELPHYYRSCPRGSPKRQELFEATGTFQIPYLEDPNTGTAMFESDDIKNYLMRTYSAELTV
eukprot:CAMPEP_0182853196 /NCGR_PEP_ID=MMETSP0034_2-20130328/570_1 /TAXON_ID=156128 /ORGANISM="Nephroselmis pyriformis, Strain CCMP717" /LENGTH=374 /DNA_ID=CAMNT_0024983955 /DNA_START=279 /DNA_END=1403 /DNA_ORIENTATION=+